MINGRPVRTLWARFAPAHLGHFLLLLLLVRLSIVVINITAMFTTAIMLTVIIDSITIPIMLAMIIMIYFAHPVGSYIHNVNNNDNHYIYKYVEVNICIHT